MILLGPHSGPQVFLPHKETFVAGTGRLTWHWVIHAQRSTEHTSIHYPNIIPSPREVEHSNQQLETSICARRDIGSLHQTKTLPLPKTIFKKNWSWCCRAGWVSRQESCLPYVMLSSLRKPTSLKFCFSLQVSSYWTKSVSSPRYLHVSYVENEQ